MLRQYRSRRGRKARRAGVQAADRPLRRLRARRAHPVPAASASSSTCPFQISRARPVAQSGHGADQHEAAHTFGKLLPEAQRDQTAGAEARPAPRGSASGGVQNGQHVLGSDCSAVAARFGRLAFAVTGQVPQDQPIAVGEFLDLLVPHPTGRANAVRQQDRRAGPMRLVVNARAVSPQLSQRFLDLPAGSRRVVIVRSGRPPVNSHAE